MAKVNLSNVKKSKNNKNNNKKDNQNNKNTKKELEAKKLQKEANLTNQAKQFINELENEIEHKYRFNKKKRDYAINKVEEINKLIENKEFKELENWINSYKELKEQEKREAAQVEKEKRQKTKEPLSIRTKRFFQNLRIPVYSRIKKIIKQDKGKTRFLKLLAVFGMVLVLIAVFVVGVLMIAQIIPFEIGIGNGASQIFPAVLIAISLGLFFFI